MADREEARRQAKKLKSRIGDYESTLSDTEAELLELGLALPNDTHSSSPIGGEEKAVELERFGPDPIHADTARDHLRIAERYGLLDNDASIVATGSSWPYLKGTLALLEMAIVNYAVSVALRHGYTPVIPPDVIRSDIAWRCGFQPRDPSTSGPSQTYHLQTSEGSPELCLAGTSEIPLSAMFANQVLPHESLPHRVVGIGRAFRAEAGARGSLTRGLYRVHQFTKVELFSVCEAGVSEGVMEEMRVVQAEIARGLGLSVRSVSLSPCPVVRQSLTRLGRVLDMPSEELGASAYRKYDMEAWMPGRGKWGEVRLSPSLRLPVFTQMTGPDHLNVQLHGLPIPPPAHPTSPLPLSHHRDRERGPAIRTYVERHGCCDPEAFDCVAGEWG